MIRGIFIVPVVVDFVGVCCCLLLEFSLHPILAFVGSSSCSFSFLLFRALGSVSFVAPRIELRGKQGLKTVARSLPSTILLTELPPVSKGPPNHTELGSLPASSASAYKSCMEHSWLVSLLNTAWVCSCCWPTMLRHRCLLQEDANELRSGQLLICLHCWL